ncbi:MAG: GNAT family N-acetyltransferase [Polyangiales bacterium]
MLRGHRLADFDTFARFSADPVMMRTLSGVLDRRAAWRLFSAFAGAWMLTGAGWWAMELSQTGEFIGTVGAFFRADMAPVGPDSDLELSWSLFPPYWRKGYATEAARAALACGFERHGARRANAHISHANAPSIAVAKAIGMSLDREVDFYGERLGRYVIERTAV